MLNYKKLALDKIPLLFIIAACILFGAIPGAFAFVLLIKIININLNSHTNLLPLFILIIGIGSATLVAFFILIILKSTKSNSVTQELVSFKDFTHSLHKASSESDMYKIIFIFMSLISSKGSTTLYYREDTAENNIWQNITNSRAPLCTFCYESCPILNKNTHQIEEVIGGANACACLTHSYKTGSYFCISIPSNDRTQAILQLYNKDEYFFNHSITSKIESYAEISKLVINNRKILHSLDKKASTDTLTGLFNRSFLNTYLEDQVRAAALSGDQLSIIMLDIDHYKGVNDTFGHMAGDMILVYISELVLKYIRSSDLAARFGGDEFLIVLPSTDTDTAVIIAERILCAIADFKMPQYEGKQLPSVSCSLGISTFSGHCNDKDNLIRNADIALYKAKQSGRNCIMVYTK